MQINSKTLYEDFKPFEEYVSQEDLQAIKQAAEEYYGGCWNLTIDEFWQVVNGDYSRLGIGNEITVLQEYWKKRFAEFCEELKSACNATTMKPSTDMAGIEVGTINLEAVESMLVFVRDYFGLPSFFEAGRRTMGEFMLARKAKYNEERVARNWQEIQRRKLQQKR